MALPHDAAFHRLAEVEHRADLVGLHAASRDAGPGLDDRRDRLAVNHRKDQRLLALQRAQPAGEFAEFGAMLLGIAGRFGAFGWFRGGRRGIDLGTHRIDLGHQGAFGFPALLQFCQLQVDALLLGGQLRVSGAVIGSRGRLALDDLQLGVDETEPSFAIVDRRGDRVLAHRHARAGCVEQAHGLVRQLTGGNVAGRQPHRVADRLIEDAHLVVKLERRDESAKHGRGDLLARLLDFHRLEAARQRGVLLEVLLVFRPGRRRDRAQLAARQGRLEEIGGIVLAGLAAGADQRVGLVDEEDDRLGAALDLVDDRLEAILEFAFHAGAGLQKSEIEGAYRYVAQSRWNIAGRHAQREAFDDSRLAHARFAGEDGIVLPATREDVDHLPDFGIATEDGIDLSSLGLRREIGRELVERRRTSRPYLARAGGRAF